MNTSLKVFQYNGSDITFNTENGTMINATQMAKPFGKRPNDWLNLPSTYEYVQILARKHSILPLPENLVTLTINELCEKYPSLIKTVRGGLPGNNLQGTWLNEDLALVFAQWLSPEFYLWCNDRIKELLTVGITAMPQTVDDMLNDPETAVRMLTALIETRKAKAKVEAENKIMQPKAEYHDKVLSTTQSFTVTQIAKDYGMSATKLNRLLAGLDIQYRVHGQWVLKNQYADKGYIHSKTSLWKHKDGSEGSSMLTLWTQKGRRMIYDRLKEMNIIPVSETMV